VIVALRQLVCTSVNFKLTNLTSSSGTKNI
jgi:hypothetical protein